MGDDAPNAGTQTHYLNKEEEFRVEVKIGTSVKVTLTDGTAEIFGAELSKDVAGFFGHGHQQRSLSPRVVNQRGANQSGARRV